MQNSSDGGEAILEAFRKLGVDYILSSPGTEWAPVWEAMARQTQSGAAGPALLDCWHETLAVNMATGYTLATGRAQAVLLHAASGLLQGSLGLQGALLSGVPMVVMSAESLTYGEQPGFDPGRQWIDNLSCVGGPQRLVEPLTKFATQVTSPYTLYGSVIRAGELAQRAPRGPTYLNVPFETMLQDCTPPGGNRTVPASPKLRVMPEDLAPVAEALMSARNPLVITEAAGRETETFEALLALCEALALPVVEPGGALFVNFPRNHPLHQGHDIARLKDQADLVLVIRTRVPWYPAANRPGDATVVVLDETPHRDYMAYQNLQADLYLEGDVASSLRDLATAVEAAGSADAGRIADRRAHLAAAHGERMTKKQQVQEKARARSPIDPIWLCAALGKVMPAETVYLEEVTTHTPLLREHIPCEAPQHFFTRQGGLGQGLGLSLGIKLAKPDQPVVALLGDGAFLYNPVLQSLGASRDYGLPILVVIFNNGKYASMRSSHLKVYPDGVAAGEDRFYGVNIDAPDFTKIVEAFGGHGERIEDPDRLEAALAAGLEAVRGGRTAILDVVVG